MAQMQNIAYTEFLPSILSQDTLTQYHLNNKESLYNESVSPVILVEFSTAAFRMGHSLVSSLIDLYKNLENPTYSHHSRQFLLFRVLNISQIPDHQKPCQTMHIYVWIHYCSVFTMELFQLHCGGVNIFKNP